MARINICIPVLNGEDFLEEALASISAQTDDNYAVLVSNNASTDRTGEILEAWKRRLPLETITRTETVPMAENFNGLLDQLTGTYYMVLCHDDFLQSRHALAAARTILESNNGVSAVYCDLAYVSEKRRRLASRRFGRQGLFIGDEVGRQSIKRVRNMFGIPLLIRSAALGTHRYDNRFRYVLDVDLSWQISKAEPAWHIPEVLIANRYHSGNSTWGWHSGAAKEYINLASKHGVALTTGEKRKIWLRSQRMSLEKRLFSAYERLASGLG